MCWWKFHHRFHYRLRNKTCVPVQSMSIIFSLWYVTIIFLFLIIMRKKSCCVTPVISLRSYTVELLDIHTISSLCSHPFLNCFIWQHVNISTPFYITFHARCCTFKAHLTSSSPLFRAESEKIWYRLIDPQTDSHTDGWTNLLSVVLTLLHIFFLYLLSYSFFSLTMSFSAPQKPFW